MHFTTPQRRGYRQRNARSYFSFYADGSTRYLLKTVLPVGNGHIFGQQGMELRSHRRFTAIFRRVAESSWVQARFIFAVIDPLWGCQIQRMPMLVQKLEKLESTAIYFFHTTLPSWIQYERMSLVIKISLRALFTIYNPSTYCDDTFGHFGMISSAANG